MGHVHPETHTNRHREPCAPDGDLPASVREPHHQSPQPPVTRLCPKPTRSRNPILALSSSLRGRRTSVNTLFARRGRIWAKFKADITDYLPLTALLPGLPDGSTWETLRGNFAKMGGSNFKDWVQKNHGNRMGIDMLPTTASFASPRTWNTGGVPVVCRCGGTRSTTWPIGALQCLCASPHSNHARAEWLLSERVGASWTDGGWSGIGTGGKVLGSESVPESGEAEVAPPVSIRSRTRSSHLSNVDVTRERCVRAASPLTDASYRIASIVRSTSPAIRYVVQTVVSATSPVTTRFSGSISTTLTACSINVPPGGTLLVMRWISPTSPGDAPGLLRN